MLHIINNVAIDENGCWVWQKSCSSSGYGQFTRHKKYWNTHRYVWQFYHGEIAEGLVVRHLCHNTKCCNIEHLDIGTHQDNYNDSILEHKEAARKQRMSWIVGENTYNTSKEAVERTGISIHSIIKFTCPDTRVFDIDAYRRATIKAGWRPKI